MGNEPGSTDKVETCVQTKEMREVLRPSIVGLGPKELYVKPLLRYNGDTSARLQIRDTVYYATRRRYLALPRNQKSGGRKKSSNPDKPDHAKLDRNEGMNGISYLRIGNLYEDEDFYQWKVTDLCLSGQQTPRDMTRRSRPLDIHGLSRTTLDSLHPLPEKPEEPGPPSIQSNFNDRLSLSSELSTELSSSTPSSPTTGRFSHEFFNESISSSTGTGENTITGRSSTYSWGNDDEFDRKASAEVRSMFAHIDCCLFENTKHTAEMKDECSVWMNSFPYLRVLGKQVIPTEETGTEVICRPDGDHYKSPMHNNILEDVDDDGPSENISLSVTGQKIEATVPPHSRLDNISGDSSVYLSHLKEEVFAMDGEIEEFIAYDKNSVEYREKRKTPGHFRKKYGAIPPVTPDAFVHETAINECFDQVWIEVIRLLKGLLKLYIGIRAKKEMERQHALLYSNMDGLLDSIIELPQSRDDFSRVARLPSQLRLNEHSNMFVPKSNVNGLKELMTIRSVALQHRAPSVNTNIIRDEYPAAKEPISRPVSSVLGAYRQFPKPSTFRAAEQQFYDRMLSAKFPKRNSRLQPLQTPKTAGHVENAVGEVRGTRLQKGDRASPIGVVSLTQQLWGARNGMLPPLERLNTGDAALFLKDKRGSPKRNSRASSAVSNDSKTFVVRERLKTYPTLPDSRASTSHSYRDLPINKSIMSQQGKLKETLHASLSKPIFHQTINEKSHFYQFPPSFKPYGEDTQDFDDFILWGHGPPLISPQRRKGKTLGNNAR